MEGRHWSGNQGGRGPFETKFPLNKTTTRVAYRCSRVKPVGTLSRADRLIWHHSNSGIFSFRSAYHHAFKHHFVDMDPEMPTRSSQVNWAKLWKLGLPPRTKFFLWRACRGSLPILDRLRARGMHLVSVCSGCGRHDESIDQCLLRCPKTAEVWLQRPFGVEASTEMPSFVEWFNPLI